MKYRRIISRRQYPETTHFEILDMRHGRRALILPWMCVCIMSCTTLFVWRFIGVTLSIVNNLIDKYKYLRSELQYISSLVDA